MKPVPDHVSAFGGYVKLSDPTGHSCSCPDVQHFPDWNCPVHHPKPATCPTCGGLNGQHYSQCPADPWGPR